MGLGKWIGGVMGFMTMGPLGALAGYFIGSWFENSINKTEEYTNGNHRNIQYEQGQRNSFLFSMLVMASYIIRADRKIMHSEMEFMRNFLRTRFGMEAQKQGEEILLGLFERAKQLEQASPTAYRDVIFECGGQIADNLTYEQRLQLLYFLMQIAQSDGNVSREEVEALKDTARAMRLSEEEVISMFNLRGDSLDDAYKVLEIDATATDEEVRKAFKKLALKHHPDKVATLGEDVRRVAEEKFQQINNAKERIYKSRGMK